MAISYLALYAMLTGHAQRAQSIRHGVLICNQEPTSRERDLLNLDSLAKIKEEAKKIDVQIVETERWILEICPSAWLSADVINVAIVDELGYKPFGKFKSSQLSPVTRKQLMKVIGRELAGLGVNGDSDDLELSLSGELQAQFERKPGIPSMVPSFRGGQGTRGLTPASYDPNCQFVRDFKGAKYEDRRSIRLLCSAGMSPAKFREAWRDVLPEYYRWFGEKWDSKEAKFREAVLAEMLKDPKFKDFRFGGDTNFEAMPEALKKSIEKQFRSQASRSGMSDSEVDELWAKAKFTGMRYDHLINVMVTKNPGYSTDVGLSYGLFSGMIGP